MDRLPFGTADRIGILKLEGKMISRQFVTWHSLQCEFGTGSWAVVDGILTVSTAHGSKSAQLGNMGSGEALARLLMREMRDAGITLHHAPLEKQRGRRRG